MTEEKVQIVELDKLEVENKALRSMIKRLLGTIKGLETVFNEEKFAHISKSCKKTHDYESIKFIKITGKEYKE